MVPKVYLFYIWSINNKTDNCAKNITLVYLKYAWNIGMPKVYLWLGTF